jgi:hypothetical protein
MLSINAIKGRIELIMTLFPKLHKVIRHISVGFQGPGIFFHTLKLFCTRKSDG